MILSFHPCFVADAQIILGDRKLDSTDFSLINRAEAIVLPLLSEKNNMAFSAGSEFHEPAVYGPRPLP
jgi:hypothetical protein